MNVGAGWRMESMEAPSSSLHSTAPVLGLHDDATSCDADGVHDVKPMMPSLGGAGRRPARFARRFEESLSCKPPASAEEDVGRLRGGTRAGVRRTYLLSDGA